MPNRNPDWVSVLGAAFSQPCLVCGRWVTLEECEAGWVVVWMVGTLRAPSCLFHMDQEKDGFEAVFLALNEWIERQVQLGQLPTDGEIGYLGPRGFDRKLRRRVERYFMRW